MLCALCLSMFTRRMPGNILDDPHHLSHADLEEAASNGCYLCSELLLERADEEVRSEADVSGGSRPHFQTFNLRWSMTSSYTGELYFHFEDLDAYSSTFEIIKTSSVQVPTGYDDYLHKSAVDLPNEPWRVRDDGFAPSSASVPESTGDPETINVARKWLTACLANHTSCETAGRLRSQEWYPKRLLDVSAYDGHLRLVTTADEVPRGRYATLSHCWGPNPSICCLTSETISQWQSCIPMDILTKTFREAIVTAHRLQLKYLWIDSLCILQSGPGSHEDWLEHAVAMRSVYGHAVLNIAVARAASGEDGAFTTRAPELIRPCHVLWRQPPASDKQDVTWTIRKSSRHSSMAIKSLPLYTRAWVVQERFLAPRVLHFGADRLMWECNELPLVDESMPEGVRDERNEYENIIQWPFSLTNNQFARWDMDCDPVRVLWQDTVDDYTRCDLSFPEKDNFAAMAGVAARFGEHYGDQYVAGFFRQHLPFDLLWENRGERRDASLAPSWSWASIEGIVKLRTNDACPLCSRCCDSLATVLETSSDDLVDPAQRYGPVEKAWLTLSCQLIPCWFQPAAAFRTGSTHLINLFPSCAVDAVSSTPVARESIIFGHAEIDTEEDTLRGNLTEPYYSLWAVPIIELKVADTAYQRSAQHRGLLVKRNEAGDFIRAGIYHVEGRVFQDMVRSDRKSQKVCLI